MSILVTGGAGFIGSHLIEHLLRSDGPAIICLDNFNRYYDPARKRANIRAFVDDPRVRLVEASFCSTEVMCDLLEEHDVQQIVHLGAYAGVRYSVKNPGVYQRVNVGGTLALLEAARRHPVERFVLASSSTVYGKGALTPFVEDGPLGVPTSPYGASKRAAELFGQTYYHLHGVPVVCLRFFSVYGPRVRPDLAISIFTDSIARGRPLPLYGDGSTQRDFTHVSDICDGIIAALVAPDVDGQAINLGHDEPLAMRDVIATIEVLLGRTAIIDRRPGKAEDLPVTHADLARP